MRDATLEFRLSVYNAKPVDEGLYTCTTPKNLVMMMVMYEDEKASIFVPTLSIMT